MPSKDQTAAPQDEQPLWHARGARVVPARQCVLCATVAHETLVVRKRRVTTARVRVRKTIRRQIVRIDARLVQEERSIERLTVDRVVEKPLAPCWEGDTRKHNSHMSE